MVPKLYLEDIQTGQLAEFGSRVVTEEEIIDFALQFDPQVFHLDPEGAKKTFFKGLAASGIHTFGMSMRMIVESPFCPAGGIISTGGDIRWKKPVRPGDTLRVKIEVKEILVDAKKPDRGSVTMNISTLNQEGDAVQTFNTQVLVTSRNAARQSA